MKQNLSGLNFRLLIKLFTIFAFSAVFCSEAAAQVYLFTDSLKPATKEAEAELAMHVAYSAKFEEKIEELRKSAYKSGANKESKTDLTAFLLRKLVLKRDRPYEENEEIILEAADLLPGNFYVESAWGDLLYFKGDYDKAMEHFENALYSKPDDQQLLGKAAITAMQLMNYEKAIGNFEKLKSAKPESFFVIFSLGRCHFELKHFEEAVEFWEKALQLTKDEREIAAVKEALNQAREMLASTESSTREEDQRFVIHFAGESQQDLGDVTFEMLEEIFFQVTDSLDFNPDVKINVVFFLTDDYYKVSKEWSAASARGIQIMVPLKSGYKSTEYVKGLLAHEFTHTIIHLKTNNRCPLWLNEGLAQYQEFTASYGSPETIRPDYDAIMQTEFIDKQNFVKLNQVPMLMGGSSRQDISRAYIASYLAARCMAEFYGEQSFNSVLSALGSGKSIDEAMVEATGKSMNDFQREYEDWLRNL